MMMGLPPFMVVALRGLQQAMDENLLAPVSDDVLKLTGRAPESVKAFLKRVVVPQTAWPTCATWGRV
jgi:hypothetical protein